MNKREKIDEQETYTRNRHHWIIENKTLNEIHKSSAG